MNASIELTSYLHWIPIACGVAIGFTTLRTFFGLLGCDIPMKDVLPRVSVWASSIGFALLFLSVYAMVILPLKHGWHFVLADLASVSIVVSYVSLRTMIHPKHWEELKRKQQREYEGEQARIRERVQEIKRERERERAREQSDAFYASTRWRRLRYAVLRKYGERCMLCGSQEKPMHVDHIMPRSRYPELQWKFDNLQVLCRECNLGKGARWNDDWRRKNGGSAG